MEPVKVPQHLELDDVIAWGLEAVDLMWVAGGASAAWWIYTSLPFDFDVRIFAATPFAIVGLALGVLRFGGLALREWIGLAAHYTLRPRVVILGGEP